MMNGLMIDIEENEEIQQINNIFEHIFYFNKDNKPIGIIKSTQQIPSLLNILLNSTLIDTKETIIDFFNDIFTESPYVIEIFKHHFIEISKDPYISYNTIELILHVFFQSFTLNDDINRRNALQEKIHCCINIILSNTTISRKLYDYVYRRLGKYLGKSHGNKSHNNHNEFLSSIKMLQILYGKNVAYPDPLNYMYFGAQGLLDINLKDNKYKPNYGCTMIFWMYIEHDVNSIIIEGNENLFKESVLFHIQNTENQEIKVILNNLSMKIIHNKKEYQSNHTLQIRTWYQISFILKPKHLKRDPCFFIKINENNMEKSINDKEIQLESFNCDKTIKKLSFFHNFIGRISSLILLKYHQNIHELPHSVYNDTIIKDSLKGYYPNYMKNTEKLKDNSSVFSKEVIDNTVMLFIPLYYEHRTKTIDDIVLHFTGNFISEPVMLSNINGVIINHKYTNQIQVLGNISALLPIAEQLFIFITDSQNQNNGSIPLSLLPLLQEIFFEYLQLISLIVRKSINNYIQANTRLFFQHLSLFLNQFPKSLYTSDVLKIIIEMGKTLVLSSLPANILHSSCYFNHMLVNERIIFKFTHRLQIELWQSIYEYILNGYNPIQLIDIPKICILLREYDSDRYKEFCCNEHCDIFAFDSSSCYNKTVMTPTMKTKIEYLIKITIVIIKEPFDEIPQKIPKQVLHYLMLFRMLSLDLSPCFQLGIITVFKEYFKDPQLSPKNKDYVFQVLLENDCIDIILYVMSIALMDVKCEMMAFLSELISLFNQYSFKYEKKYELFYEFLQENILPSLIEIPNDEIISEDPLIDILCLSQNDDNEERLEEANENTKHNKIICRNDEENDEIILSPLKAPLTTKNSKSKGFSFDFQMGGIDSTETQVKCYEDSHIQKTLSIDIDDNNNTDTKQDKHDDILLDEPILKKSPKKKPLMCLDIEDEGNDDNEIVLQEITINKKTNIIYTVENEFKSGIHQSLSSKEVIPLKDKHCSFKLAENSINEIRHQKTYNFKHSNSSHENLRKSVGISSRLNIDINKINQEAEDNEKNFQSKVFQLAKHCVNFLIGNDTEIDCHHKRFDHNSFFTNEQPIKQMNRLHSIHEDENESRTSNPIRLSNISLKELNAKSCIESIIKKKQSEFHYELHNPTNDHKCIVDFFKKDKYLSIVTKMHITIFGWLDQSFIKAQSILCTYKYEEESIIKQKTMFQNKTTFFLIDCLIKICSKTSKFEFIVKVITYLADLLDLRKRQSEEITTLKDTKELVAYNDNFSLRRITKYYLYNHKRFYNWLIDTTFQCYLLLKEKTYITPFVTDCKGEKLTDVLIPLLKKCQSIHLALIFEEKNYKKQNPNLPLVTYMSKIIERPNEKIDFLLTWGAYQKSIYRDSNTIILHTNDFIHQTLLSIINQYNEEFASHKKPSDELWSNFLSCLSLCYEYFLIYNNNFRIVETGKCYIDPNNDSCHIPPYLYNGLSKVFSEDNTKGEKLENIWLDYNVFKVIYDNFKHIWNYEQKLLDLVKFTLPRNSNTMTEFQIIKLQLDRIISELVFNKKMQNSLPCDILFYSYTFNTTRKHKEKEITFPLIQMISNLLGITISIIRDENSNEAEEWINQYKSFLIFCIIASCNMSKSENDYHSKQKLFYAVIVFGFNFLLEQSSLQEFQSIYRKAFVNVIYLISRIVLIKRSKEIELRGSLKLFCAKPVDLSQSAIMLFVNEFSINLSGSTVLDLFESEKMEEFFIQDDVDYKIIIDYYKDKVDLWKKQIKGSGLMKIIRQLLFDDDLYEEICKRRYENMSLLIPFYTISSQFIDKDLAERLMIKIEPNYILKQYDTKKKKIIHSIKNIVPFFSKEMKVYHDNLSKAEIMNKRLYQKKKQKLFSWLGSWSNQDIFFGSNNTLKYKILNHYTSDLSKPILAPILDLDYYLPCFSQFDKINLFMKNNDKTEENDIYKIDIDIGKLLSKQKDNETDILSSTEKTSFYLRAIYESNANKEIWETDYLYQNNTSISNNVKDKNKSKEYSCCFVKLSIHLQGSLRTENNMIIFKIDSTHQRPSKPKEYQETINDSEIIPRQSQSEETLLPQYDNTPGNTNNDIPFTYDYDEEKGTCYGSFFASHNKDNDLFSFKLLYTEIVFFIQRKYFYRNTGIEIYTINNKSYFFNFKHPSDRNQAIAEIKSKISLKKILIKDNKENSIIGYYSPRFNHATLENYNLSTIVSCWRNWKISTFEFLMWLNLYSNRSYTDLIQYPVFPWIFTNYSDEELLLPNDIRPFDKPMGLLEIGEKGIIRKELYMGIYDSMRKEEEEEITEGGNISEVICNFQKIPYCFGSHYSNPIYISHFLLRLFPFANVMIELQGNKFDDPNRLFFSLQKTFESATTTKCDVRELCPEFYYLPEMFININRLEFGLSECIEENLTQVMDVKLPPWANNNPIKYIEKSRRHLEGNMCNSTINNWIDLIFGSKQRGKKAQDAYNIFLPYSYDNTVNIDKITDKEDLLCIFRILEMGITPSQILFYDLEKRNPRPQAQFFESDKINSANLTFSLKYDAVFMKLTNESTIYLFNRNNDILELVLSTQITESEMYRIKSTQLYKILPEEALCPISFKINSHHYDQYKSDKHIAVYSKGLYYAEGGFWDGRILLTEIKVSLKKMYTYVYCESNNSPIVVIKINKEETLAYCGTKNGCLIVYKIKELQWSFHVKKHYHYEEITSICLNTKLKVLATASYDGYVILYTLPQYKNFRVIQINQGFADHIFISMSPVPSIVFYSNQSRTFTSYSINGTKYNEIKDTENCPSITQTDPSIGRLMCPIVFTDIYFTDYLLYAINGSIIFRKFPGMELKMVQRVFDKGAIQSLEITDNLHYVFAFSNEKELKVLFDSEQFKQITTANLKSYFAV